MYQQRGDLDAGLKLFQESMGWCVMNAISCVSAQIPLYADDAEHLEACLLYTSCRNLNLSYKGNKILKDIHFHIPEERFFV